MNNNEKLQILHYKQCLISLDTAKKKNRCHNEKNRFASIIQGESIDLFK